MRIRSQIHECTKAQIVERFYPSDNFILEVKIETYYKCREKIDVSEFVCVEAIEKVLLNENRS